MLYSYEKGTYLNKFKKHRTEKKQIKYSSFTSPLATIVHFVILMSWYYNGMVYFDALLQIVCLELEFEVANSKMFLVP